MSTIHHSYLRLTGYLAAAMLSMSVAAIAQASAPMVKTQAPAYYRLMLGNFEITALLDDNSPWPTALEDLYPQLSASEKAVIRQRTVLTAANDASTNAFLINTGARLILIDTGGGPRNHGQLLQMLKASGYLPEQVDDVFLTHLHADHVGGLLLEGRAAFPNASVHVEARELAQWQQLAGAGKPAAQAVLAQLDPYLKTSRVAAFSGATSLLPGLRSVPAYGHTAGHSFYVAESDGKKLLLWGDLLVNEKLQLDLVDLAPPGEADGPAGITMRRKVYADAARDGTLIASAHAPFPGIGRVRENGERFVWIAVDYAAIPAQAK